MDATKFFNEALPTALINNAAEAKAVNAKFQFNIKNAGQWYVDLTNNGPSCKAGTDKADCIVDISSDDFRTLIADPSGKATTMFFSGKLKVSNMSVGMRLQKLLALVK